MTHLDLIAALRAAVEDALRPLLAGRERVALIDFPNYPNVGDSAIYLGELACLAALGVPRPAYTCDILTYDPGLLARQLGSGTILLAGGGNFGDLWESAQRCREAILASFPRNPIIQLPQTIHFEDSGALRRARRVFDAHPDVTLLVRDHRSLEIARNEFRAPSLLCPDLAFGLGPLPRPAPPTQRLVWLARTDQEGQGEVPPLGVDWLDEPQTPRRVCTELLGRMTRRAPGSRRLRNLLSATYAPLARERLRRGCRLLGNGRVVVTDRLHGHILSLLLGIPHVVLDNSYGKLSSFHQSWTAGCDLVRWADSPREALLLARALADEPQGAAA